MKIRFTDRLLRLVLTRGRALVKARRSARPRSGGAHALALTPGGAAVLVRLRYASGWRLPGGGIDPGETAQEAVLRELREEIGMTSHGEVRLAPELEEKKAAGKRPTSALFIVRDVRYRPRWSFEVESVRAVPLDALPDDLSPRTERWLRELRRLV